MSKLTKSNGGTPEAGFRLDKHNGKLFGVCSGIAKATDTDAIWWRLGFVAATLLGFGLTIPIYIAVALIAD